MGSTRQTILDAASQERLLLHTYGVSLPKKLEKSTIPGSEDPVSVAFFRKAHPCQLEENLPLCILGDSNCLYGRGLYGSEDTHQLIRLLTALEMIEHPTFYDVNDNNCLDMINGQNDTAHDDYMTLLQRVCTSDMYCALLHMYGASAALRTAFTSYCPPTSAQFWVISDGLNRRVIGRKS